jgi:hypothetical protein
MLYIKLLTILLNVMKAKYSSKFFLLFGATSIFLSLSDNTKPISRPRGQRVGVNITDYMRIMACLAQDAGTVAAAVLVQGQLE